MSVTRLVDQSRDLRGRRGQRRVPGIGDDFGRECDGGDLARVIDTDHHEPVAGEVFRDRCVELDVRGVARRKDDHRVVARRPVPSASRRSWPDRAPGQDPRPRTRRPCPDATRASSIAARSARYRPASPVPGSAGYHATTRMLRVPSPVGQIAADLPTACAPVGSATRKYTIVEARDDTLSRTAIEMRMRTSRLHEGRWGRRKRATGDRPTRTVVGMVCIFGLTAWTRIRFRHPGVGVTTVARRATSRTNPRADAAAPTRNAPPNPKLAATKSEDSRCQAERQVKEGAGGSDDCAAFGLVDARDGKGQQRRHEEGDSAREQDGADDQTRRTRDHAEHGQSDGPDGQRARRPAGPARADRAVWRTRCAGRTTSSA